MIGEILPKFEMVKLASFVNKNQLFNLKNKNFKYFVSFCKGKMKISCETFKIALYHFLEILCENKLYPSFWNCAAALMVGELKNALLENIF